MKKNPYRYEIICVWIAGPLVIAIEIWRRWDDLLNPGFYDDPFYFSIAMFAAYLLYKQKYTGQLLWLYASGIGTFMMFFSLLASFYEYNQGDVSGVPMPFVIAFKLVGVILISIVSLRALNLLRRKVTFDQ